jgi:aspartate kinase
MKFGGTSVGDPEKLKRVAGKLVAARELGSKVVAVVSAMGHTTDELVDLAHQVSPHPHERELDMLLSVGERISCALVAMAIVDLGHDAISLTGSQAGIVTDSSHTKAKIVEVRAARIHDALEQDRIVLVAGFQGVSGESLDVTTLGRGGSDTTAVALAAALGADACQIYTDVRGVFTADPRLVATARKLDRVSFEEMLEMASSGAGVMMARSIEIARTHNVRLNVRSSFEDDEGTWITEEDDPMLEKALISAVVHQREETVYRVGGVTPATLFGALAGANVNVDTILQSTDEVVFSAPPEDRRTAARALDQLGARWEARDDLGKVSVIGAGMKSHPGVAAKTFATLERAGIAPVVVSTSPIKIACHIPAAEVETAVRALHDAFELA